jgi:phage baseplate assembly protein W
VASPLALDARGQTRLADDERYVRGLIEQVLFTRPGERVMRPEFGTGVDALVFAPAGDELASATQALVQGALQRFLGDLLRVDEVTVVATDGQLDVTIRYVPLRAPAGEPQRTIRVSRASGSSGGSP